MWLNTTIFIPGNVCNKLTMTESGLKDEMNFAIYDIFQKF